MYLDAAQSAFDLSGIAAPGEVHGCSREDVRALEHSLGCQLPGAYREFLRWMGCGAGPFLEGTDVFLHDLSGLNEAATGLLQENDKNYKLPSDAFVFYMHQGYQFMFFRLSEGDDPPVYFFGEGEGLDKPKLLYDHFSSFLMAEIDGHKRLLDQIRQRKM